MPLSSRGKNGFLLMVDLASAFVSVALLSSAKAEFIQDGLWDKWLSIFGIPSELRSDQGRNVDGKMIRKLCDELAIKKNRSTPYHPEGNGAAERAIGSIKGLINRMCLGRKIGIENWDIIIYEAVLAHNTNINKSRQFSPFMSMFSDKGRLPVDNFLSINQHDAMNKDLILENAHQNRIEAQTNIRCRKIRV